MARVLVDASIAVKWFIDEPDSPKALEVLQGWLIGKHEVAAPSFMRIEAANAFASLVKKKLLSEQKAEEALLELSNLQLDYMSEDFQDLDQALTLAMRSDTAVYDCIYHVLSKRIGAPLLTADEKYFNKVKGENTVLLRNWKNG